jgi:hypothetical protein
MALPVYRSQVFAVMSMLLQSAGSLITAARWIVLPQLIVLVNVDS